MGTQSMRTYRGVLENRLGARETWPEEGVLKKKKKMASLDQVQKILGLLRFGEVSYRKVSE